MTEFDERRWRELNDRTTHAIKMAARQRRIDRIAGQILRALIATTATLLLCHWLL